MGLKTFTSYTRRILRLLIRIGLKVYKKGISPYLPMACRYYPSCSDYMQEAITIYGIRKGLWLGLKRLGRCQPFGGSGIDFVPIPDYCKDH
jgi:putative membrane protein insertion efficiency factor